MTMLLVVLLLSAAITSATPSTRIRRQATALGQFQTQPRRALVLPGGSITIVGKYGTPLRVCHFYLPGATGRLVDLSQGHASASTDHHEYAGSGLDKGECGIKIKNVLGTDDGIVECKIQPVGSSQWGRSVTTLRVTDIPGQDLPTFSITPQRAVLPYGANITITCNADRPITLCHIYLPGGRFLNYDRGADSDSTTDSRYHGLGLEDGHCGATLTGVDHTLNGYVVCKVGQWPDDLSGPWETDALHITTNAVSPVILLTRQQTAATIPVTRPTPPVHVTSSECPALSSDTLLMACLFAGERTNCGQPQEIGTTAVLDCKPGFAKASNEFYRRITCKRGGKWDRPLFSCIPDCGRRNTNAGETLVSGGKKGLIGEFAWHVGVYELKGRILTQMCGGTLISPDIVISAAHCFWDEDNAKIKNASKYKLAAGKQKRLWEDVSLGVQKRDVTKIVVPATYRGRVTNYAFDIAVVRTATPFDVTSYVNLACIDWDNLLEDRQLSPNIRGLVTGWGYTEDGRPSESLMYVQLPYVTSQTCLGVLPANQHQLFTSDKFCAGYVNKSTSVCAGDSGGGLVFKRTDTDQYYLRGIVSIAFTTAHNVGLCYSQLYTGFIKFSSYRDWVQENMFD